MLLFNQSLLPKVANTEAGENKKKREEKFLHGPYRKKRYDYDKWRAPCPSLVIRVYQALPNSSSIASRTSSDIL